MRLLCYLAVTLLCGLSLSSSEAPISCIDTQYRWPSEKPKFCCDKCPPGTRLDGRNSNNECCPKCKTCESGMYQQTYNRALTCNICENCQRTNMKYLSRCNATHNAVCKCKAGYECKTKPCVQCLPIPATTINTTLTPTTLTATTPKSTVITLVHSSTTRSLQRDASWYPIIIALLSAGIVIMAVVFVIKDKTPLLRCIRFVKYDGFFSQHKPHTAGPMSCVDEEISKPVQEAGCDCKCECKTELEPLNTAQIQV